MKAHYFIPTQAVTTFFVFPFLQLIALYLASVDIGKGYRSGISLIGQGWFVNFFFSSLVENAKVILGQWSLKAFKRKLHSAWCLKV